MLNLIAYAAFVRAYELGSFSAVAREMGITQSTVSKYVASLEQSHGVQLFARTTRRMHPTAEAAQLYAQARQLLDAAEAIRSSSGEVGAEPTGLLRLTLPDSYGRHRVMPVLPGFLERHPKVRLDIRLTDHPMDLVEEGLELGVRIGELNASTLVARSLGIEQHRVVATPGYLSRHGEPDSPAALSRHNCIVYTGFTRAQRWAFESEHGRQVVEVTGSMALDSADAIYAAVLADLGIAMVPGWLTCNDLAAGRVRLLLDEYYPAPMSVHIVYPQTRVLSLRARAFIDHLVDMLGPKMRASR